MEINWISLLIAAIIPTLVGFGWYNKALFGNIWMESIGLTEEDAKSVNMPMVMGISLVVSFLIAFFLLQFNNGAGQEGEFDTFKHGAAHGAILTIFLVGPVLISGSLWAKRSWKAVLVDVAYWAVTLAIMGGIVDAMNHWPNEGAAGM